MTNYTINYFSCIISGVHYVENLYNNKSPIVNLLINIRKRLFSEKYNKFNILTESISVI